LHHHLRHRARHRALAASIFKRKSYRSWTVSHSS
jgi:hypothetical protein